MPAHPSIPGIDRQLACPNVSGQMKPMSHRDTRSEGRNFERRTWHRFDNRILRRSSMTTARKYRKLASKCLRWATEVQVMDDRQAFLDLARDWTLAAMRLKGLMVPETKMESR